MQGVACSRMHHSGCSHIMVSPDGGVVYAATRTDGRIAQFAVGAAERPSFILHTQSHPDSRASWLCTQIRFSDPV